MRMPDSDIVSCDPLLHKMHPQYLVCHVPVCEGLLHLRREGLVGGGEDGALLAVSDQLQQIATVAEKVIGKSGIARKYSC